MKKTTLDHVNSFRESVHEGFSLKSKLDPYLNPYQTLINHRIQHGLNLVSNGAVDYLIKPGYQIAGSSLVKVVGIFSAARAKKIEDFWHDPISTQTFLAGGQWVEKKVRAVSRRKAVSYPVLSSVDKAIITVSKNAVLPTVKFVNSIARIPDTLRSFLNWTYTHEKNEEIAASFLGRNWEWVKTGSKKGCEYVLRIVYRILKTIEIPLRYVPLVDYSLNKLLNAIDLCVDYLHQKVVVKLNNVIDYNEKKLRKRVVAKAVDVALRPSVKFLISSCIKWYIADAIWRSIESVAIQSLESYGVTNNVFRISYLALNIVRAGVWVKCFIPTVNKYSNEYSDKTDPELSLLGQVVKHINYSNVVKLINFYNSRNKLKN